MWLIALASVPHLNSHPMPTVGLVPMKQKRTIESRVLAAVLQVRNFRLMMAFPVIVTWEGTATQLRAGVML